MDDHMHEANNGAVKRQLLTRGREEAWENTNGYYGNVYNEYCSKKLGQNVV